MGAVQQSAVAVPESELFGGAGEVAERLRRIEWARTPLGPVPGWTAPLRATLNACLASRLPGAILWGPERTFLYNDAYAPILGSHHPAALGESVASSWPDQWETAIRPVVERAERTGDAAVSEDVLVATSGGERWFRFSFSPLRNDSGAIAGLVHTLVETTTQVVGTRRLRTLNGVARQALRARTAADACRQAAAAIRENGCDVPFALIYLLDDAGQEARIAEAVGVDPANPAWGPALRLDGPSPWPLLDVARTGKSHVMTGLARTLGPLPGPWPDNSDCAVVLPLAPAADAPLRGFLVAGTSPRRPFDADYQSFLSLLADQLAAALANAAEPERERQRAEALADAERSKATFLSNVSHEFRTPLTLMLGPLEDALARRPGALSAEDRAHLETVHRNGLRLLKLVNTMLDFSRFEAGRAQPTFEPTDLARLTEDLTGVFRAAVERAGLRLAVDCPPLREPVWVDREMWEKIVLNLLSNAFKFTFEGEIGVRLRLGQDGPVLEVSDTGAGIEPADIPNLFKRFHHIRNARARTQDGSGLGLALTHELVALHGGRIEVASEPGRGTTFTVRVPVRPPQPSPAGRSSNGHAADTVAPAFLAEAIRWLPDASRDGPQLFDDGRGAPPRAAAESASATVLFVADNADLREYVRRLLGRLWDVEVAPDGLAALERARARMPDLVLSDVKMPGLDGFGLLRELRRDPKMREVPVILLSATTGEGSKVEGLDAGADDYLIKPFSAPELVARVRSHLGLARIRRLAREDVRRSEERYRRAMRATSEVVWDWDLSTNDVVRGGSVERVLGFTAEEMAQDVERSSDGGTLAWWGQRLHADDHDRIAASLRRALEGSAGSWCGEYRFRRRDGACVHILDRAIITRDDAGKATRITGAAMDVTERKRAEEALRESREHLSLALEVGELATWDWDLRTGQVVWSERLFHMLGLPVPGDGLGHADFETWRSRVHPEDVDAAVQAIEEARTAGTSYCAQYRIVRARTQDVAWVEGRGRFVYDGSGRALRMIGVLRDITERRCAEDEIRRLNESLEGRVRERTARLEEAVHELEGFSYTIAHDLRAPLRAMHSFSEFLIEDYAERIFDAAGRDYARRIAESARRMDKLVQDLLTYSRLARQEARLERIDLAAFVSELVAQMEPEIRERRGKVTVEGALHAVLGHRVALAQALTNLVSNALKFVATGVEPLVVVRAERRGGRVRLWVTDNGIGIEPDQFERIFGLFQKLHSPNVYAGTGVGLAIVRKAVEKMGGVAGLESEPGRGSRFWVELHEAGDVARRS